MTKTIFKPLISYHGGHSSDLCVHAQSPDTKADLIRAYAAAGFSHVGVVEHLQPPDDRWLYPEEIAAGFSAAALTERLDRFFATDRAALLSEYSRPGGMNLAIGFETEFYGSDPESWLAQMIGRYKPDFLVASVHHVRDIPIDYTREALLQAAADCGGEEQLAVEYFESVARLIRFLASAGVPAVIGHLDLIKLFWPGFVLTPKIRASAERTVEAGVRAGFPFEVNARAFKKGLSEPYPGPELLRMIKAAGGRVTFGDDAHAVGDVGLNLQRSAIAAAEHFSSITAFERNEGMLVPVELPLMV